MTPVDWWGGGPAPRPAAPSDPDGTVPLRHVSHVSASGPRGAAMAREARPAPGPAWSATAVDDRTAELSATRGALTDVAPVPPAYHLPNQRGPVTTAAGGPETTAAGGPETMAGPSRYGADAPVPEAPPSYPGQHRAPRPKYFALRIAAVVVLVFGAAVGVAVTVLSDSDPDTVQVADDLPPDARALDPTAGAENAPDSEQPDPAAQQQTIEDAQSRAADKAADAQADAAQIADDAAEAREKRAEESGTVGAPVPTAPVDCETLSGNKNTGCALLSEFGFPSSEMTCLEQLWTKESGWNEKAENTGSGAYGIPQALPGEKMASVADDWRTNPATQIRWGLGYIKGRYQTPCGAWTFFQNNGHY